MSVAPRVTLAIDAGNSRTKIGLFRETADALPHCIWSDAIPCDQPVSWHDVQRACHQPARVIAAGSNPAVLQQMETQWPSGWPDVETVTGFEQVGIRVDVEFPGKVGIDRLLNAVAVNALRGDSAAVVVDSGTATTVDWIDARGAFRGGAILPGIELSARALHDYTARLPHVSLGDLPDSPPAVGRNTREAIQSGLLWGQLGAIQEIVRHIPNLDDSYCVLTGGGADRLAPHLEGWAVMPHLPLQGLTLLEPIQ